jgi:ubiquinone/menaquinone biosynthesis C-methylase UbiE
MLGELPAPVQEKTLAQAASMLKNNGQLIVCDEFWPDNHVKSLVYHLLFWIFYIPNFILTRTLIQPVKNFNSHINKAGLKIKRKLNLFMGAMTIYWLEKK